MTTTQCEYDLTFAMRMFEEPAEESEQKQEYDEEVDVMDPRKQFNAKIAGICTAIDNTKNEIKQLSCSLNDTKTKIVEPFIGAEYLNKIEDDCVWKNCSTEEFKSKYLEHEIKAIREMADITHSMYLLGLKVDELELKKQQLEKDKQLNYLLPCELYHEISLLQQCNSELQQRNTDLLKIVTGLQQQVTDLSQPYVDTQLPHTTNFENGVADYLCSKARRKYPTKDMAIARLLTSPTRESDDTMPYTYTSNVQNSFIRLDLTPREYLQVTHYCLSQNVAFPHFPRNWELQGATDETKWVTLCRHDNDASLDSSNLIVGWDVPPLSAELLEEYPHGFCYFRILQHDVNVSGHHHLSVEKLDLHGCLRVFRI